MKPVYSKRTNRITTETLFSYFHCRGVNGKTRMGIFTTESMEEGEPLTYDYRNDL